MDKGGGKNEFCFRLIHLFVQPIHMEEVLKLWERACSSGKVMRRDRKRLIHLFAQQTFLKLSCIPSVFWLLGSKQENLFSSALQSCREFPPLLWNAHGRLGAIHTEEVFPSMLGNKGRQRRQGWGGQKRSEGKGFIPESRTVT